MCIYLKNHNYFKSYNMDLLFDLTQIDHCVYQNYKIDSYEYNFFTICDKTIKVFSLALTFVILNIFTNMLSYYVLNQFLFIFKSTNKIA